MSSARLGLGLPLAGPGIGLAANGFIWTWTGLHMGFSCHGLDWPMAELASIWSLHGLGLPWSALVMWPVHVSVTQWAGLDRRLAGHGLFCNVDSAWAGLAMGWAGLAMCW